MTFILKFFIICMLASFFVNTVGWFIEDVIFLHLPYPRLTWRRLQNVMKLTWLWELLTDWWAQAKGIVNDLRKR